MAIDEIDIEAVADQLIDGCQLSARNGAVHRCLAALVLGREIGAVACEQLDGRERATFDRRMHRCATVYVLGVDIGAVLKEGARERQVVRVHGVV